MKLTVCVTFLSFITSTVGSHAADICKAIALRNVPALEEPQSILKRGDYDYAITQYRVDRKTRSTSFCSHGGYCYPAQALGLTNCKIGKPWPDSQQGSDFIGYDVDVIRSKVSPADLQLDDLDNKLLEMGLCSACASNAAYLYLRRPSSSCGRLTKKALEGDPIALAKLKDDFPSYCNVR